MSYNDKIIDFTIKGFERTGKKIVTNDIHKYVLKNKLDNFFGKHPDFKFHRWAGSLKSSQAFAFNIFSGVDNAKFEYDMWTLDSDPQHKACIDVAIENKNGIVDMYEVKMFEFAGSVGKNQIFHKPEQQKYFCSDNYKWNKQIAEPFITFIRNVRTHFNNQHIYGEGIKQLCCHLLGIINEMTIKNGKLVDKKVELYSLCFDNQFLPKFQKDTENYEKALEQFKYLANSFLQEINIDDRIKYCGFLSASKYIKKNEQILGKENYNYVLKRYFYLS